MLCQVHQCSCLKLFRCVCQLTGWQAGRLAGWQGALLLESSM
jgi:hypothetical protein